MSNELEREELDGELITSREHTRRLDVYRRANNEYLVRTFTNGEIDDEELISAPNDESAIEVAKTESGLI